ncbi:hypothetical protein [Luteolibacter marinus]|uniref:hypothetical protein n=1 Tax=Luteolibacter marinus TaxID=2776705 RepID=UPI0018670CE5|nr:hypothetical protein [Luteolibacter marinus]
MKPATTFILAAVVGGTAFLAARQSDRMQSGTNAGVPRRVAEDSSTPTGGAMDSTRKSRDRMTRNKDSGKIAAFYNGPTAEEARLLTSAERMDLIASGAQIYNSSNQIAFLTGVIGALTADEIPRALESLGGMQDRGNGITQQVWDSLWRQWGRVDPEGGLRRFGPGTSFTNHADARNMMEGWLETDAAAALAWAREPKQSPMQVSAAARAITSATYGDLERMRTDIAALPEEALDTREQCLKEYFDMALLSEEDRTIASICEDLPESLQEMGRREAQRRMAMVSPDEPHDEGSN